jgi:hypothetical protein
MDYYHAAYRQAICAHTLSFYLDTSGRFSVRHGNQRCPSLKGPAGQSCVRGLLVSSGHNANRGRNGNSGTGNGGNNRRARRTLSHQRNPQNQSVVQHRTEAAPASIPTRVSEVSASLEPEGIPALYEDQADQPIQEMGSLVGPSTAVPDAPVSERPDLDSTPSRPEASSGQLRTNRRSPQLIPSASTSQTPLGRGPALHSIRAPFAPGQNHVHTAGSLRGQVPVSGTDASSSDHTDGYDLTEKLSPPQREPDTWRPPVPRRANEDTGDLSARRVVPGRGEHSSRDERPLAWSRQEQGTHESTSFEGRDVRGDIGELIDSLHELFERDRGIASQSDTSRCGICYLHFSLSELQYREEEGFYVCPSCDSALAHTRIVMVRRQQHS